MFIPENEQGVFYLFSRHHEKLGFKKVVSVQTRFPDVIALRDGRKVRIELEYLLSRFKRHYLYKPFPDEGYWKWDGKYESWRVFNPRKDDFIEASDFELRLDNSAREKFSPESAKVVVGDPDKEFKLNNKGELVYRTLEDKCDCIICWDKENAELVDDIEVIELKDMKLQPKGL